MRTLGSILNVQPQSIHRKPPTSIQRLPTNPPTLFARQKRHDLTNVIERPHALLHRRHRLLGLDDGRRNRLQHLRLHRPRGNGINRRPISAELCRPAAREAFERGFAAAIEA